MGTPLESVCELRPCPYKVLEEKRPYDGKWVRVREVGLASLHSEINHP